MAAGALKVRSTERGTLGTQQTNYLCRRAIDIFKFIGTFPEHYSSNKIKTTID
ncbi:MULTISPECIES: hypothetical protein [unclassified Microcoleus]|uniref:hypothetical protein n=1 Tax=unclassified Microcoleus TaxID=2642155 RepID=UPI0025DCE678|nr:MULTISPECIES: hypothetical protein [unclassified Microcoleus]